MKKRMAISPLYIALLVFFFISEVYAGNTPRINSITPQTVTEGDEVTIVGDFGGKAVAMKVLLNGKEVEFTEVKSGEEIKARVGPVDTSKRNKTDPAGLYKTSVIVEVDAVKSEAKEINQVTWDAVRQPQVVAALIAYFALAAWIMIWVKGGGGGVFRSKTGQWSLSKIQMGLWTVVFAFFYVLLSAIWGRFLDITEGMFWLMGISSATAVGAKAIVVKNGVPAKVTYPSTLLSDWNADAQPPGYRLSLHRCQIAIWTLIIVVIYVLEVLRTMQLADIPNQLLVLMGISGGTYLGFNFPKIEKKGQNVQRTSKKKKTSKKKT